MVSLTLAAQVGLQLHGGHQLTSLGKDVKDVKDVLLVQQQQAPQVREALKSSCRVSLTSLISAVMILVLISTTTLS